MAIPSRQEQARKFAEWLEAGAEEEEDLQKFSLRVVDAFHEMIKSGLKGPLPKFEAGEAFKSPLSSKVYWVAWKGSGRYWITQADSNYGWMINEGDSFFEYATPSSAKTGRPGQNKDGWIVGDHLKAFQGSLEYEVLAVHDKGALLQLNWGGPIQSESNEGLAKYYTKESK